MSTLHKKIPQSNGNIINLSKRQEEELIKYSSCAYKTDKACKHILIKYVKIFIGNKISYELCKKLWNITLNNDLFKVKLIRIKEDLYSIFYIDDFICLVRVADAAEENIYIEHYNDIVNLNGYTLAYYIQKQIAIDSIAYLGDDTEYISFLLYKDDIIYIRNDYYYNEELDTSISCTKNNIRKNIDLTNKQIKQIKDYWDSMLVISKLKGSD